MKDPLFGLHFPNSRIRGTGNELATMANIKGVTDDKYNLFRELPFWLRIGPISWHYSDHSSGHYYIQPSWSVKNGIHR